MARESRSGEFGKKLTVELIRRPVRTRRYLWRRVAATHAREEAVGNTGNEQTKAKRNQGGEALPPANGARARI